MIHKQWILWLFILSILLPVTSSQAAPSPVTLVVANDFDFEEAGLDPARAFSDTYLILGKAMYDQLTTVKPDRPSEVAPLVAQTWEISPDGTVYTFHLRQGILFSTGRELTAEDVKFSYERLKNVKSNPAFFMDGIKSITVPDPYTVRITLEAPDATFLQRTGAIYTGILDRVEVQAHGGTSAPDAATTDQAKAWLDQNSAGSGPFILKEWVRNTEVRLEANPNYWGGRPQVDIALFKAVQDPTTQAQMLSRGDVDIALNIDFDTAEALKNEPGVVIEKGQSLNLIYIGMTANPEVCAPCANQKFRQAVSYAIDYNGLNNGVLAGNAITPPSILTIGFLGADLVPPLQRDLAKAKQLLAESGVATGTVVQAKYANFNIYGVDYNIVMQKLQADLAEIGIALELVPMETSVFLQEYRGQKVGFAAGWWAPDYLDPHSNIDAFAIPTGVIAKRMFYKNLENVELVAKALQTTDREERAKLYAQIIRNLQTDANFLGLIQPKVVLAYRKNIEGYIYHPIGNLPLVNIVKK